MSTIEYLQGQLQSTTTISLPSGKTIIKGILGTLEGECHTCLWWNAEEAPAEGSQVTIAGKWKSYKEKMEMFNGFL